MNSRIVGFGIAGIVLLGALFLFPLLRDTTNDPINTLKINNKEISLIVVDTFVSRSKGLSGRESLSENFGMLFVFEDPGIYGFWMKDMKFPIDIIWTDEKYKIVHIEKNVSPNTFPKVFNPPQDSLYVLELNAGFADKNDLKVGNVLKFTSK